MYYTLDVSQYVIGTMAPASEKDNFYHCINKALQKREPVLLGKLSGQKIACMLRQSHTL